MEEYYSGLLAALSNWWKEAEILWKEKITIINWCGFCLIRHSISDDVAGVYANAGSRRKATAWVNLKSGFCI